MKKMLLSLGALVALMGVILFSGPAGVRLMSQEKEKKANLKKLYITAIKADGVSPSTAARVREGVRLSIFENHGGFYQVMDDDAIRVMYKQAELIMASGNLDQSSTIQIANAINADEIIYGEVRSESGRLKISLTILERVTATQTLGTKNITVLDCTESQVDHYAREAGKKLMDKNYRIAKAPDDMDGRVSLRAIEIETIGEVRGMKGIEGLGIAVLGFTTPDESLHNILAVLKRYVQEGDALFQSGKYDAAARKYLDIVSRMDTSVRPEKKASLDEFMGEVRKRVVSAYSMKYKERIDGVDPHLSAGDFKKARSGFSGIIKDMEQDVPAGYRPELKDMEKGLLERIDASWVGIFKQEIDPVDARLKSRDSADERFLTGIIKDYSAIKKDLAKVPYSERGKGVVAIFDALDDRVITLRFRMGDAAYREYRFNAAMKEYDAAMEWSKNAYSPGKKAELMNSSRDRQQACLITGRNYLLSRVKSFIDRAEVFNLDGRNIDARKMMNNAYRLMTGPMVIFATKESVGYYNSLAGMAPALTGVDRLEASSEEKLFASVLEGGKRLIQIGVDRWVANAQQDFKKRGGGRSKTVGGMEFIYIPDGEFWMGSPEGVGDDHERPRHRVEVSGFWIGKYEVTQGQYESVMGTNPSRFKGHPRYPVENVNWHDAKDFCAKFGARHGVSARLPTEAEWEYAARAGNEKAYLTGDTFSEYAFVCGTDFYYIPRPWGVGNKPHNAWGLHDMSGNVSEWCEDWYAGDYYAKSPVKDPKGPVSGSRRVHRGGAFSNSKYAMHYAYRGDWPPEKKFDVTGFRVVLGASP